jgi:hypothetical protein
MNYSIEYADKDYREAVNYDGTNFYNYPVTITVNDVKYLLSVGSADFLTVHENSNIVVIIGENSGLDYISCTEIDTKTKEVINDVFVDQCDSNDFTAGIFDKDFDEQYKILSEYMC